MPCSPTLHRGLMFSTIAAFTLAGAVTAVLTVPPSGPAAGVEISQHPISADYSLATADPTPTPTSTRRRRRWHPPAPTTTTTPPTTAPTTAAPPTTTPPPTTAAPTTSAPASAAGGSAPASQPQVGVPAGTVLQPMGPLIITTPGTVIDRAAINGPVVVNAANVVIRRSRVSGDGDTGIYVRTGSLLLEDVTVHGFDNSIGGDNYTATRVEVTQAGYDGFKIGSNVTIQDSWCHDLVVATGAHSDCGQVQSGVVNVILRRNWFDVGPAGNSALFIAPDLGPSSPGPVLVENNVLGGGNYTLQCVDGDYGRYLIGNITIRGNQFLNNSQYGAMRVNVLILLLGNIYRSTGLPILL